MTKKLTIGNFQKKNAQIYDNILHLTLTDVRSCNGFKKVYLESTYTVKMKVNIYLNGVYRKSL